MHKYVGFVVGPLNADNGWSVFTVRVGRPHKDLSLWLELSGHRGEFGLTSSEFAVVSAPNHAAARDAYVARFEDQSRLRY